MTERPESGFTLLETMVAFAILLLALGMLMPLFGDVLDHSARASAEARATTLARSLLDRVGLDLKLADGTQAGDAAGYHWQVRIAPYGSGDDRQNWTVGAHTVVVTVAWSAAGRQRDVTLSTLRLGTHP